MFTDMEKWAEIRRRVLHGEMSKRAACAEYEIHWDTLTKILTHSEPPGYRRTKPRESKLESFLPVIEEILKNDREVHRKQRHTAKRIFERLVDEHGYEGGETIVKDAVRAFKQQHREVFLPLSHPPGEAQVDFGFAEVHLNGKLTKVALFVMTLPYSDAIFMQAFPRECAESFLETEFAGAGTREFIKVLRRLERHLITALKRAVQYGLGIGATSFDAIRLILEYQQEQPIALFCLDGRPHLKLVQVAQTDVSAYQSLLIASPC